MGGETSLLDDAVAAPDGLDGRCCVILLLDDGLEVEAALTLFRSWVSPSLSPRRN